MPKIDSDDDLLPVPDPAKEIVRLHAKIQEALRTTLVDAIRAGELLTEQKAKLGHGKWLPWVKSNLPFTSRTASSYMKLFEERDRLETLGADYVGQAYRLLSGPTEVEVVVKSETVSDLNGGGDGTKNKESLVVALNRVGPPPDLPTDAPRTANVDSEVKHEATILFDEMMRECCAFQAAILEMFGQVEDVVDYAAMVGSDAWDRRDTVSKIALLDSNIREMECLKVAMMESLPNIKRNEMTNSGY